MNPPLESQPAAIVLTDAPAVVALKREFARLCRQEELLKAHFPLQHAARMRVDQRKAEIARLIFKP